MSKYISPDVPMEDISMSKKMYCRKFPENAEVKGRRSSQVENIRTRRENKKSSRPAEAAAPQPTFPYTFRLSGLKVRDGDGDGWFSSKISLLRSLSAPLKKAHEHDPANGHKKRGERAAARGENAAAASSRRGRVKVVVKFDSGRSEISDLAEWSPEKEPEVETPKEVAQRIQKMTCGRTSQTSEWRLRRSAPPSEVVARVTPLSSDARPFFLSAYGTKKDILVQTAMEEFDTKKLKDLFFKA